MLIRVYVDTPEDFRKWIAAQQKPQPELAAEQASLTPISNPGNGSPAAGVPSNLRGTVLSGSPEITEAITPQNGQLVFERQACISCHTIRGTVANGRYGPDLTHLMSRVTLGAGAALNTPGDLLQWIADPNTFKPGCLMPAMHLTDRQNQQITAYLLTLK